MRHLTTSILVTLAVLLGSAGESFALPECPGSPTKSVTGYLSWNNCEGTFTSADGSKYVGEFKYGKGHGQGTVTYANGDKYVGEYKDGKRHGQGTLTIANGSKYVGEWKDGKGNGQGTYYYLADNQFKGDKYVGEIKDGKKHGQGTYTFADGRKYVGEFKDGNAHGQGTETLANGDKYVGEFKDYKRTGQGTYYFLTDNQFKGDIYVGEWKDDKYHGQGTYTHADGRVKEGIWENGGFKYAQKITPTVTAKKTPKPKPAKQVAKKTPKPKTHQFKKVPKRPDDIVVIIANSNYKKLGKGIPNVTPAYADAEGIKRYFMNAKGVREGNIIYLKDATKAQMTSVFGSEKDHKGKLFNWTKPNISKVYVYYAGHGAPAGDDGTTYLVPSDTDNETVQLTAYPLKQLYSNLGKIPATSITVILEACFSGQSQGGTLFSQTSGISIVPRMPLVPSKITVISAGAAKQVASWEKDNSQSLFTKYFLTGMSGEGDRKPYGNGDGKVSLKELKKYLNETMTYYARRYYGRTQTVQMIVNGRELSVSN